MQTRAEDKLLPTNQGCVVLPTRAGFPSGGGVSSETVRDVHHHR